MHVSAISKLRAGNRQNRCKKQKWKIHSIAMAMRYAKNMTVNIVI